MLPIIWIAKIIQFVVRLLGKGGGTALPGLMIERRFPELLHELSKQIPQIYLVTGTNGKTTTAQLLCHFLRSNGQKVISNESGANLIRGIASTLIGASNLTGRISSDAAVFEVEEASMPILTKYINPQLIIVTNIFRDQLDAYGGLSKVFSDIRVAIDNTNAAVLINGNDPQLQNLAMGLRKTVYAIGLDDSSQSLFKFEGIAKKINLMLEASIISVHQDLSTEFSIRNENFHSNIPGIHNVINTLLAFAAIKLTTRVEPSELKEALNNFKPVWGRGETIELEDGPSIRILLIKNPAGLYITLNTLKQIPNLNLFLILNDSIADGRDVSWIWDVDNEIFDSLPVKTLHISGTRAFDMNVRIKYTHMRYKEKILDVDISDALESALKMLKKKEVLYILPTYTGLLELRKILGKHTSISSFWK